MQNQVENVGSHLFKAGAMVIPGQIGYDLEVDAIMLQESFLGADVALYRTQLENTIMTSSNILRQKLMDCEALKFCDFTLTSGKKSNY